MIKITAAFLKKEKACEDGIRWFRQQDCRLLKDIIPALLADDKASYARWLLPRLMTHSQQVMWAVFSAELVLDKFETVYPKDDRPRKAIQAAKAFLTGKMTADAAYAARCAADAAYAAGSAAWNAAWSAADAAYADDVARNAASAAGNAAWSAAYAAYAAGNAARCAARSAAYAAGKEADEKIMAYGLELLGEK